MAIEPFVELLGKRNIHFFHFTDARNIPSIQNHGLLSMREIRARNIETVPGGNQHSFEADVLSGMDDFVHLCFKKGHPMAFRAQQEGRVVDLRWLRVSPAVLSLPGVLICDEVSNKSGAVAKPPIEMVETLDWQVLHGGLNWKDPQVQARLRVAEKYEVLVPKVLARDLIRI